MSKILTQEEIDALLFGVEEGAVPTQPNQPADSGVVPYDLTNQDRVIRERMPSLEIINDQFSRFIRNTLSSSLRKILEVSIQGIQMIKFGEFIRTLPVPSSLHIFKMEPLRGHAILVLDPKMVFTLIDLFLGGSGKGTYRIEGREFTAIESRLIYRVVVMILTELEKAWQPVHPVSIQYLRSEINPQFVSIVGPNDLMIMTTFGLELEQFTGMINICIPYALLEPIKNKLYSGYQPDRLAIDKSWIRRFEAGIQQAEIDLVVELGRTQIKVKDLLNLKIGDTLVLNTEANDCLIAKVQGVPKYLGHSGLCGANKAFQVKDKISLHLNG